jgi:hypothetical protein
MARAGRFRIGAMEALWAQLQFAPPAAAQRMVSRIRSFIVSVGPDTLHSPADVVREVVKFPVEQVPGDADAMFVGAALRADLAELHLRLSRRVPARGSDGVDLADAARSHGVSVRTLRRWREQGLLLHWIGDAGGRMHVGVLRADLDSFVRANGDRVTRAARFSQLSARERRSIVDAVRSLSGSGLSERRAIAQVAMQHGRAPATVRTLAVPVMERSRAAARRAEESHARASRLWRLWCRGVPVGMAARHLGISDRMAQHALHGERVRRLLAAHEWMAHDAHGLDPSLVTDSEWVLASAGLAVIPLPPTAEGWLSMRIPQGTARPRSGTLAVVMRALLARAASAAAAASSMPAGAPSRLPASELDRAETDLRWAARILLTLTADAMPAIDARVRVWRASITDAREAERLPRLADLAIGAVLEACAGDIASLRSGRTRIERLASAQMDLALARADTTMRAEASLRQGIARSAAASRRAEAMSAQRAMERAVRWSSLGPLHDDRAAQRALAGPLHAAGTSGRLAQMRFGWHGGAPQTIAEIAHQTQRPTWVVAATIGRLLMARQL